MNHEIDLKKYDIHTDLVLDTIENSSLSIKSDTYNIDDIKVTKVNVDEETSKILNKKKGNYITIEFVDVTDTTNREKVTKVFEDELKTILSNYDKSSILVVGLGNAKSTPDSLGPKALEDIIVTRHLFLLGNPEENKSVVGLDDVGNIPVDSAFLLVYAADGDGQILKIRTLGSPTQIFTSGKQFMADNSKRESARWEEALDRLIEWGWVKAVGYKGEIFELTGTGYSKADWLKNNMAIDTSKEPLDELKEFED